MAVNYVQTNLIEIEPLRLYDTPFVAALAGISTVSIRKATSGLSKTPLIPRITRLGVGTLRFSGRDILAWLEDPNGASEQARFQTQPLRPAPATGLHSAAPRRRAGRPSNRERDAARSVGGMK